MALTLWGLMLRGVTQTVCPDEDLMARFEELQQAAARAVGR